MKTTALLLGGTAVALIGTALIFTPGWNLSRVHTNQTGYRGLSVGEMSTAKSEKLLKFANALPDAIDPADAGGQKATSVYKNVQVLTDLSAAQFDRVMLGFAAWVGGENGCNTCHNPDNLADDSLYTKKVARKMIEMTRHINKDWQPHVLNTGVTCYTCHRGQPVPKGVWYNDPGPKAHGVAATNYGMGHPAGAANGYTAMTTVPFSGILDGKEPVRIQSMNALTQGPGPSVLATEKTYSLMMSISYGLGVNCTYCHSSRVFWSWSEGNPLRVNAWQGINLVRDLNTNYLAPLASVWPANRLGPTGDGPKLYCMTCHQGAPKPLLGAKMAKDWTELGGVAAK
jgi:photosynthetic reaction center cytochrome c subunit